MKHFQLYILHFVICFQYSVQFKQSNQVYFLQFTKLGPIFLLGAVHSGTSSFMRHKQSFEPQIVRITRVLQLVKQRRAKNSTALTPVKLIPSKETHRGIYGGHGQLLCLNMTEPNAWKVGCPLEPGNIWQRRSKGQC